MKIVRQSKTKDPTDEFTKTRHSREVRLSPPQEKEA